MDPGIRRPYLDLLYQTDACPTLPSALTTRVTLIIPAPQAKQGTGQCACPQEIYH